MAKVFFPMQQRDCVTVVFEIPQGLFTASRIKSKLPSIHIGTSRVWQLPEFSSHISLNGFSLGLISPSPPSPLNTYIRAIVKYSEYLLGARLFHILG